MRKFIAIMMVFAFLFMLCACGKTASQSGETETKSTVLKTTQAGKITVDYSDFDLESSVPKDAVGIELDDNGISSSSDAVSVKGKTAVISKGGVYIVSGKAENCQLRITAGESDKVRLILNGVNISNSSDSPIYAESADKVVITLNENTKNVVSDNAEAKRADSEVTSETRGSAAIFSKCALTFNGKGSLNVTAKYNNAVQSKKTLKFVDGNITAVSQNNAFKAENAVCFKDGAYSVTSDGDGIETSELEDTSQGFVLIEGGKITVESKSDGINASLSFIMRSGTLNVKTTGAVTKSTSQDRHGGFGDFETETQSTDTDENSSKGIKAGADLCVTGGNISVNSTDHAIHSANSAEISDGNFSISSSSGKGITAHGNLNISGGTINITESTEGIESKKNLTVNGGKISVVSSDDGFNASGQDETSLNINGGDIFINSEGDGLDSNGDFVISAGTVVVAGPTNSGNGAIDASEGTCKMTGGTLIAYGSAGMAEYPDEESTQNVVSITLSEAVSENELVAIVNGSGKAVAVFKAMKQMQNVVISSADIEKGDYTVYTGGSYNAGKQTNGVYSGGSYKKGTQSTTFTVSSVVTTVGSSGGSGMFNPGGGKGGGNFSEKREPRG